MSASVLSTAELLIPLNYEADSTFAATLGIDCTAAPDKQRENSAIHGKTRRACEHPSRHCRSLGVQESCSSPHVTRGTRVMHLGDNMYAGGYTGLTIQ